jgi:hypothetical protein
MRHHRHAASARNRKKLRHHAENLFEALDVIARRLRQVQFDLEHAMRRADKIMNRAYSEYLEDERTKKRS